MDGGTVAWLGQQGAAETHRDVADAVIDLQGALVTPAFVDAHVHATSAGLTLIGLDLSTAPSLASALATIESESRRLRGAPLLGHGWDESTWPEGRAPTRTEIDRATHGSVVYLSRRDVHSAVVSSALVAALPGIEQEAGFDAQLPLTAAAHGVARKAALEVIAGARRSEAQEAFLRHCATVGIAAIHECAGPTISGEDDLLALQRRAADMGMHLTSYWGEAGEQGVQHALALGARPGGDLFVDGSLGSRTAWLSEPYADAHGSGNCYLDETAIEDHLVHATAAGVQAGFHAIGDRALRAVADGARTAAARDPHRFRSLNHRVEHVEMADEEVISTLIDLSMIASVQPTFDWLWGGRSQMYASRLGTERAMRLNRFASWTQSGLALAFGSDAPVTPAQPWEWIRAALFHAHETERMSARAAFAAATRGGWRAASRPDMGVIAPGATASLAIWASDELVVQTPDARIAAWSTDERAGTPGLPEITMTGATPRCLATIHAGRVLFSQVEGLLQESAG